MTSLELLICSLLIFMSACMSASEIALFSLSRFQLRSLKENFRPVYRKIKSLLSDPGGLLITILVVNEILNIALSSIITKIITRASLTVPQQFHGLPSWAFDTLIGITITAPILLFLCEITPKVIGARINQLVAPVSARPLIIIYKVFKPVRSILKHLIRFATRYLSPKQSYPDVDDIEEKKKNSLLNESDFLLMVEEGQKAGAIQESEVELIRNVFQLDNTSVSEISTPLSQVLSLTSSTTVKGALAAIRNQQYSRVPITNPNNKKEVVGILYSKDLLRSKLQSDPNSTTIDTLMRKPLFVSSSTRLNALFRKFKQQKTHMAIVKGPDGEIVGVVTMSDILDALFEDFFPDDHEGEEDTRLSTPRFEGIKSGNSQSSRGRASP